MQDGAHRLRIVLIYTSGVTTGNQARVSSRVYTSIELPMLRHMTAAFREDCGWPEHVTCQSRQVNICSTFTCGCAERQDMPRLILLSIGLYTGGKNNRHL